MMMSWRNRSTQRRIDEQYPTETILGNLVSDLRNKIEFGKKGELNNTYICILKLFVKHFD